MRRVPRRRPKVASPGTGPTQGVGRVTLPITNHHSRRVLVGGRLIDRQEATMGKLSGKVAFLTGAGAGIAKATAKLFVSEGAQVAIIELKRDLGERAEREIRDVGGEALYVETDVTKDDS